MKSRPFFLLLATAAFVLLSCSLPVGLGRRTPTSTAVRPTRPVTQPPASLPSATLPQPSATLPAIPKLSPVATQIPPISSATVQPTLRQATAVLSPSAPATLRVEPRLVKEETKAPAAIIQIRSPFFSGGDPKSTSALNQQVDGWITGQREDFKQLQKECVPPAGLSVGPNSLYIDYEILYQEKGRVSIYFSLSTYCTGAAHPLPWSETLTYDLSNNRVLQLSDLFKPGVKFLETLSKACITELKKRDVFQSEEGALPNPENYKSWNLTPGGLRITFDPYQVAAYAAGPQQVTLSWSSLRDILNPAFQP